MAAAAYDDDLFLYEVSAVEHWKTRGPILQKILSEYCPSTAAVVDIGSGTGLTIAAAHEALPYATISAVEPSDGMRAALAARITQGALDGCVTIFESIDELPDAASSVDAILAFGVLGHMEADERTVFWQTVRRLLSPDGVVVVELMGVEHPTYVPRRLAGQRRIGTRRYESWISGEPAAGDEMTWRTIYRIIDDRHTVDQHEVVRTWHTFGLDQLSREAGEGFSCTKRGEAIYVVEWV